MAHEFTKNWLHFNYSASSLSTQSFYQSSHAANYFSEFIQEFTEISTLVLIYNRILAINCE